jgi:hypothetical protein
LYQAPYLVVDGFALLRIRIFTIVMIKALYHHSTFHDRTKTDTTWDGPYHNGVSRSRIMIRVSLPIHICDHDTRRRYGYGDRIRLMIHVWTRLSGSRGLAGAYHAVASTAAAAFPPGTVSKVICDLKQYSLTKKSHSRARARCASPTRAVAH